MEKDHVSEMQLEMYNGSMLFYALFGDVLDDGGIVAETVMALFHPDMM